MNILDGITVFNKNFDKGIILQTKIDTVDEIITCIILWESNCITFEDIDSLNFDKEKLRKKAFEIRKKIESRFEILDL